MDHFRSVTPKHLPAHAADIASRLLPSLRITEFAGNETPIYARVLATSLLTFLRGLTIPKEMGTGQNLTRPQIASILRYIHERNEAWERTKRISLVAGTILDPERYDDKKWREPADGEVQRLAKKTTAALREAMISMEAQVAVTGQDIVSLKQGLESAQSQLFIVRSSTRQLPPEPSLTFWQRLIGSPRSPDPAADARSRLALQWDAQKNTEARFAHALIEAKKKHAKLGRSLEAHRRALPLAEKMEKEAARIAQYRAAYVAQRGRERDMAASAKRRLAVDHPCPYCSGDLGSDPCADHIYPLSKGGRSTERNLVMTCRRCNAQKHDLTLNQFIQKFGLPQDRILAALRALGKDF